MSKVALITGVTGQIASYLSDSLLAKDYKVYGLKRRNSSNDFGHVKHLIGYTNFEIVEGDLLDLASLQRIIQLTKPHEIYNCAAQSHVGIS
ncbi:GDP-mannose 4,6-dehydratase, partial [Mangrovimonas sp. AS39]|uniref:GDP-mannose 4,6-dehydratase n=1 Tax=Mangrovimonas futianensis TaxID=2895523 RepID=UPI001E4D4593